MLTQLLTQSAPAVFWRKQSHATRGILFMCLSTIAFSVMHASIRFVSDTLPPFQIAFFRNFFGLAFLMPVLIASRFSVLHTKNIGLHALRNCLNIVAMLMFFTALSMVPLAKVTALSFTAPIFVAVLSVIFLKERIRIYRWAAILSGFVGMLLILRPGFVALDTGSLMVIGSAAIWAVVMILVKILSRTDSSVTIVAWMGVFLCVFSIGPAIYVWQTPTLGDLGWLIFIGLWGSIAQVSLSQSFRETDPTVVMPFDFLKLIWAALLGVWFFSEIPDVYTWIGAGVIFGAGLFIAHRERRNSAS